MMASFTSEDNSEEFPAQGISFLAADVRNFQKALGKLKESVNIEKANEATFHVDAHQSLSEFLSILKSVLKNHPQLQTNDLLLSAGRLIQFVKGLEDIKPVLQEVLDSVDSIALAFSNKVSEYIMYNAQEGDYQALQESEKAKSIENIISEYEDQGCNKEEKCTHDFRMHHHNIAFEILDHDIEHALYFSKSLSKYVKHILVYIEKRACLDMGYAKNIMELAQSVKKEIQNEEAFPLQSIYVHALDNDVENGNLHEVTCNLLLGSKFMQPLQARLAEHEKQRKEIRHSWSNENTYMRKRILSVQEYDSKYSLQVDSNCAICEGDSENSLKDKNIVNKFQHDEFALNENYCEIIEKKINILNKLYDLIARSEETVKEATVSYFELQHNLYVPISKQFQTLCESSQLYNPGFHYAELMNDDALSLNLPAKYIEEDDNGNNFTFHSRRKSLDSTEYEDLCSGLLEESVNNMNEVAQCRGALPLLFNSDTDSIISSNSDRSHDLQIGPRYPLRHSAAFSMKTGRFMKDVGIDHGNISSNMSSCNSSKDNGQVHSSEFSTLRTLCPFCNSAVYSKGIKCSKCNIFCHKKCLENKSQSSCNHQQLSLKLNTFGVELKQHLVETSKAVPYIVSKCTREIDDRGILTVGIYRVSGVKSKVESLCNVFENAEEDIDLTEAHPNTIASVLKLYLYKLPEPLLTFKLYSEFVRTAKQFPSENNTDMESVLTDLKNTLFKLPKEYFLTLALLMQHLKRVSSHSHINNMTASNLGIVFGPTLLRSVNDSATVTSLMNTVHQARAVELLIRNAGQLFTEDLISSEPVTHALTENVRVVNNHTEHSTNDSISIDKCDQQISIQHCKEVEEKQDSTLLCPEEDK